MQKINKIETKIEFGGFYESIHSDSIDHEIDSYYEEIQKMGGNRWDTSSLIKRFRRK